ncbi:MAG TPA: hypothetical protein VGL53_18895 [Bryobacteraceae bacterium]|jgi:hypothetical protein
MNDQPTAEAVAIHRKLAAQFFNGAWTLIDKADRTPAEDLRMIHMAHASRMHWELVGTPRNRSVGEWQISRIYSMLGRAEAALFHARNSLAIATENELPPFQVGYACEAMARALALAKDPEAREYLERAKQLVPEVTDDHDRALLEADLAMIGV